MKSIRMMLATVLLLGLALGLSGCASPVRGVEVTPVEASLQNWTLQMDLIAAAPSDKTVYENIDINRYFKPGTSENALRAEGIQSGKIVTFTWSAARGPEVITLNRDDAAWQRWQTWGATDLIVITSLPGSWEPKPGALDRRRLSLPLTPGSWKENTLAIEVRRTGVTCLTPQTAP